MVIFFKFSFCFTGTALASFPLYLTRELEFNSVHFPSTDEGWAVGRDRLFLKGIFLFPFYERAVILHYNYGEWNVVPLPSKCADRWELHSVHFPSINEGWAVGEHRGRTHFGCIKVCERPTILHYQSGSWSVVAPPEGVHYTLKSVHFPSTDEGWAVGWNHSGGQPAILHYQSGSWSAVTPPEVNMSKTVMSLNSVHFPSTDEGWAVGEQIIFHYKEGQWSEFNVPEALEGTDWELNSVHFPSTDEGWAVGKEGDTLHRGVFLHYKEGQWSVYNVPEPPQDIYFEHNSVHFPSTDEGWAVGWSNTVPNVCFHYKEDWWSLVDMPSTYIYWYWLNSVHFPSIDEGWAVGRDARVGLPYDELERGKILYYKGGEWSEVTPPEVPIIYENN